MTLPQSELLKLKTEKLEALAWYVVDYRHLHARGSRPTEAVIERYSNLQGWKIELMPEPGEIALAILVGNAHMYIPLLERAMLKRGGYVE